MLTRMDGLVVATPDRQAAAQGWVSLLAAEHESDDTLPALGATRSRYRLGDGVVDLVEPDGAGWVQDAVGRHGGHLLAGRFATADPLALAERARQRGGTGVVEEGGEVWLPPEATGGHGLAVVLVEPEERPAAGAVDHVYELTNLVADADAATAAYADLFGLDRAPFTPIGSDQYGYRGTLTLFSPDRLDRFEVIHPHDREKTMGRFFAKRGESLYMAFAESGDLEAVEAAAAERGWGVTAEPRPGRRDSLGPHTVFVHPPGLGGVMLGLSRRTYAWTWSGRPERVEVAP